MSAPLLSIILPAYNESNTLTTSLTKIRATLDELNIVYEIILINDGSSDNTHAVAESLTNSQIHLISYAVNKGKGYAVKQGMQHAKGEYRLFMDIDLATSLNNIQDFLTLIQTGKTPIIIGNRKSPQHYQMLSQPFSRQVLGKIFTRLTNLWLGCQHEDFTCGFKMFTKQACDIIFPRLRINRWAFDAELLFIARLHNLRVTEQSVSWSHQKNSKVRIVKDIITSLRGLFLIRLNHLKGFYR